MSYKSWFDKHASKHKKIVDRLVKENYSKDQIIEYFEFDNMVKNENDFCPLYADNKKCHDVQELNCYLCACPNFRFSDDGIEKVGDKTKYSFCSIDSKDGEAGVYGDAIHQNCSNCTVPHATTYVKKHFDTDWAKIMNKCNILIT